MSTPREIQVRVERGLSLSGDLEVPGMARGIVLFAHGSGSSRHSPRNRYVAAVLSRARLATLLLDLLTPHEEQEDRLTHHLRFDVSLLARRLMAATEWVAAQPGLRTLRLGYFGASTGAAAALIAAGTTPERVHAVVSRGGRPDLAGDTLGRVQAPTLLIVGGNDEGVLELNKQALRELTGEKRLSIVPSATHLFEEPGALAHVAALSTQWFGKHLEAAEPLHRST
jgi:dienelactone hydrolase